LVKIAVPVESLMDVTVCLKVETDVAVEVFVPQVVHGGRWAVESLEIVPAQSLASINF
jgi:hypothetical protein